MRKLFILNLNNSDIHSCVKNFSHSIIVRKNFLVLFVISALLIGCATTKKFPINNEMVKPILDKSVLEIQDIIEKGSPIAVWWCDDGRFEKKPGDKEYITTISYWIQSYLEQEFVKTRKYDVVTRTQLAVIFREQEFQYSGNVSEETLVGIAKILGAKYIILPRITLIDTLNIQVLNAESGKIMYLSDSPVKVKQKISS